MKFQFIVGSLLLGSVAFAANTSTVTQTNSVKVAQLSKGKKTQHFAANSSVVKRPGISDSQGSASPASSAGTNVGAAAEAPPSQADDKLTASLEEVKKSASPKKWAGSIDHTNYHDAGPVNGGDITGTASAPSGITVFGLKYKMADKTTLSLAQRIDSTYATSNYIANTTYLTYTKSDVATLPGGIGVTAGLRLVGATGPGNAEKGLIGAIRPALVLEKSVGKLSLSFNAIPYFWASQNANYTKIDAKGPHLVGVYWAWLFGYAAAEYAITSKLKIYQYLGENYQLSRNDGTAGADNSDKKYLYAESGATYAFNSTFSAGLAIQDFWNYDLGAKSFAIYPDRAGETQYTFNGTVTF